MGKNFVFVLNLKEKLTPMRKKKRLTPSLFLMRLCVFVYKHKHNPVHEGENRKTPDATFLIFIRQNNNLHHLLFLLLLLIPLPLILILHRHVLVKK